MVSYSFYVQENQELDELLSVRSIQTHNALYVVTTLKEFIRWVPKTSNFNSNTENDHNISDFSFPASRVMAKKVFL